MLQRKKNNFNPVWIVLKLLIALVALWFIYKRVVEKEHTDQWLADAGSALTEAQHTPIVLLILFLMLLNWSIEAMKWKLVIQRLEKVSFFKSLEAVFSGITVSFFTPNRIGEFAGRVFHLEKADRIEATLVTVLENFSQLIVTLIMGTLAASVFIYTYSDLPAYLGNAIIVVLGIISIASLLLYFNISLADALFKKLRLPERWRHYVLVFSQYSTHDLSRVILLSVARYLVFSFQFFLLLRIFGLDSSYLNSMLMISSTYLVMSVVPTFALTEIGVRGAVATFFFSFITVNLPAVINASFCLWLVNLVIPSLIGTFFVFEFKFGRRNS